MSCAGVRLLGALLPIPSGEGDAQARCMLLGSCAKRFCVAGLTAECCWWLLPSLCRRLTFPEFRNFFMLLPEQGLLVDYWLSGPAALSCADMGCHFSIQETNRQRKGSPWGELLSLPGGPWTCW